MTSKALDRSQKTAKVYSLFIGSFGTLIYEMDDRRRARGCVVECLALKPY